MTLPSEDSIETPATKVLIQKGIPFRVFRHTPPPATLAQAAAERGQRLEQVVRSIVFRTEHHAYVLLLLPGGYRAHWPTLRKALGVRRLTLATPEEVLNITGAPIGAVSPWGWPHPPRYILVDEDVLQHEEVSTGSGQPGVALVLKSQDLLRALPRPRLGRFGHPQSTHRRSA